MNLVGFISTAALSLTLVAAAPMYAQEQHGQDEQKAKPEEKKAQPEKSARQEQKPAAQQEKNNRQEEKNAQRQDKNTKQEEKSAQQQDKNARQEQKSQQARPEQQAQRASGNRGGRIPDDRFKANFGEQHRFRVSHADYDNHRFQYGGYWFGFVDPWPSDWLYTQDVFVVEINGVYYLCNPRYPGINITLSFAL